MLISVTCYVVTFAVGTNVVLTSSTAAARRPLTAPIKEQSANGNAGRRIRRYANMQKPRGWLLQSRKQKPQTILNTTTFHSKIMTSLLLLHATLLILVHLRRPNPERRTLSIQ